MTVFEASVPVRWVDLDAQAHVNNTVVVDYLQQARVIALLRGPMGALLGNGIVVTGHQIEYLAPITYAGGDIAARLRIGDVRAASFAYGYELSQAGRPVARARTDACLFDFTAQRPRRMAPDEKAWFASVAEPLEPLPALPAYEVGEHAAEHEIFTRWSDVDAYGHVNNVQFYVYTAEARVALNAALLPESLRGASGGYVEGSLLIARNDLKFVNQVSHRLEPYVVRTAIGRAGRTSLTFAHAIVDPLDGRLMARSTAVLVHADADGRPAPLPDAYRAAAARWPAVARS